MGTLINNIKKIKNPYIIFFPFLLFYFLIVLKSPTQGTYGDERRYLIFAENLIHGYYSTPAPEFNLWNGPGYPIALTPFVFFHLPLICITLFNAILYYLALTLFFKTLQKFFSFKVTLAVSLIWACYINSFGEMKFIYAEILSCFLVCLIMYCLVNAFTEERKSKIFATFAGISIGYIVLTKVIFGYVLLFILTSMIILWLINRKKLNHRRGLLIAVIALFTISPYLMYTYQLTGKIYYLGNSGGMSLYWMSSPYDNELGDWCHSRNIYQSEVSDSKIDAEKKNIPGFTNYLYANHAKDYEQLDKYYGFKRDDLYKKLALQNIKTHPVKYLKNCISNMERLFFSFPYSYTLQHNILQLAINGPLVLLMFFSLFLTIKNWLKITFPIKFIILFGILYLVFTIMVSAYARMFTVIMPLMLFWVTFIIQKAIKVKLKFDEP